MNIPKTAIIDLKLELNLDEWFTEDDREALILLSRNNQDNLNSYTMNTIRDILYDIIKYDEISIKLNN